MKRGFGSAFGMERKDRHGHLPYLETRRGLVILLGMKSGVGLASSLRGREDMSLALSDERHGLDSFVELETTLA